MITNWVTSGMMDKHLPGQADEPAFDDKAVEADTAMVGALTYDTQPVTQRQVNAISGDDGAEKLGSAQPSFDPIATASPSTGRVPAEFIVSDLRPRAMRPVEGIPAETQAVDFMTPESRPRELRPTSE